MKKSIKKTTGDGYIRKLTKKEQEIINKILNHELFVEDKENHYERNHKNKKNR